MKEETDLSFSDVKECLSDVAKAVLVIGVSSAKVDLASLWVSNSHARIMSNFKNEIRQIVLDDVPHQYQERLLSRLGG